MELLRKVGTLRLLPKTGALSVSGMQLQCRPAPCTLHPEPCTLNP